MKQLPVGFENSLHRVAVWTCILYLFAEPLMLQNTITPVFSGLLSKIQIADLLMPLLAGLLPFLMFYRFKVIPPALKISLISFSLYFFFIIINVMNAGETAVGFYEVVKFGYLLTVFMVFSAICADKRSCVILSRVLIYVFLFISIVSSGGYIWAIFHGQSNSLAYYYDYFPYTGTMVRMIGTYGPTSKLFGLYIFLVSYILVFSAAVVPRKVWRAAVVMAVVCSLLTVSRIGVLTLAFWSFVIVSQIDRKQFFRGVLSILVFAGLVLTQLVTIFQLDQGITSLECGMPYSIDFEHPHFGWYGQPTECRLILERSITYSSYFLMKLVAFDLWMSNFWLGGGAGSYLAEWTSAAAMGLMPNYFVDYRFPMAQSTFLTILAEWGLIGCILWTTASLSLFNSMLTKAPSGAVSYVGDNARFLLLVWMILLLFGSWDLDIQNFRFLYYMLPLIFCLTLHQAEPARSSDE